MPIHKIDAAGHWLRADAAASYLRMLAAGMPAGGIDVFGRTLEAQKAVYRAYLQGGPLAARPSANAPHVKGVAMDAHTTTAGKYAPSSAHVWLTVGGDGSSKPKAGERLRAHDFGWSRTVPSERWHFGYDPARDKRRAPDLAARLKALGYKDTAAFQKAHKLTADGIDGPVTWSALLSNPKPATPVVVIPSPVPPGEIRLRVAEVNCLSIRFSLTWLSRRADLVRVMKAAAADVYLMNECNETMRDYLRSKMPGGANRWLVWPRGEQAIMFDALKFTPTGKTEIAFTSYHGGLLAPLVDKASGRTVTFGSYHLPPNSLTTQAEQQRYFRKFLDAVPNGLAIIGGDGVNSETWAGAAMTSVRKQAANSSTRDKPTYKASITDHLWSDSQIQWRGYTVIPTKGSSDHNLIVGACTIPAPTVPTN